MSIAEISRLPLREKFQIMETIWRDLGERIDCLEAPQSHRDLLDQRRARVASGETVLRDWDAVKHLIGQR